MGASGEPVGVTTVAPAGHERSRCASVPLFQGHSASPAEAQWWLTERGGEVAPATQSA